ncbi:ribonuclease H-like domain-containing protein [Fusarium tricinctum]|uniref:ribonuclease H n=1 Tax=Fusarium tricinctum TaxID=61284 RepID=A0A8K0S2A1_9HYPO|nr:ribonuclease H-like domain-containing protein [Fusarium tricinctum]
MSWRPDSPIDLPGGRLGCGRHGLVICGQCCVDYSFMDEDEGNSVDESMKLDDEDEQLLNDPQVRRRGSGQATLGEKPLLRGFGAVMPKLFSASSSDTPQSLFPARVARKAIPNVTRFIHRWEKETFLVYTDGACLDNGQVNAKAGWACVFKPEDGGVTGRLENHGPFGDAAPQTSNRAELRAVISALRFRSWAGEGFSTLVIATDSEYVVKGATEWVSGWIRKGWKTAKGADVKNRDLWEAFLGEVEQWDDRRLKIRLWKIPREMNTEADRLAKEAAQGNDINGFQDIKGVLV